jgi:hypothetical protein
VNRKPVSARSVPVMLPEGIDGIHFVAAIDGRRLYFEAYPAQARVRVTMAHVWAGKAEALGSVIRLDSDKPGLRVCAPLEVEWAATNAEAIVAEAVWVWAAITRNCDG